jgi:MFS family permease
MAQRGTRRGPLLLLEVGNLIAGVGNGVALVVLPWLVLDLTGSASAAGAVAAATLLPLLLSSLFAGTVVDIVGRKRTAVISDVLSGLSVAALPTIDLVGELTVTWLVVLAMAGAALDPAGFTAREAMLPGAATEAGWRWDRANGVHEAVYGVAFLLGPAFGGVLIGFVGPLAALWATAIGFALAVGLTLLIRLESAGPPAAHERPRSIWHGTVEGVVYVWRDPLLRALAALDCVLIAAYLPFESVLLPVHFNLVDAPAQLGFVVTAMSGGTIVGSLAYPVLVQRVRRRRLFVWSVFSTCATLLGLAAYPGFVAMVVLGALVGLCWGPVAPIVNLAMQVRTPEELRGRVIGVLTSVAYAAGPLGLLVAGPLVDALGVRPTSLLFAGLLLAVALVCFAVPALRQLDGLVEPTHATPLHLADSTRPDAVRIAEDEPPHDGDPAPPVETS